MPITTESLPIILGQGGKYDAQRWVIEDELIIGRSETCSVFVADRQVSRFHAKITRVEDQVILEDLNSKNGTFYNGEPIDQPVPLKDGDVIQIALAQEFLFLSTDATIPLDSGDYQRMTSPPTAQTLQIDTDSRRVFINGKEIEPPLSALQFKMLAILHQDAGRVFSRGELITQVWGEQEAAGVTDQALDALIRRLRNRLSESEAEHEYIVTIRGQGFRMDNPAQE